MTSSVIYRHYKGGEYEVIGLAHTEATLAPVIVYRSVADDGLWTRPAAEFLEVIEVNGCMIRRFTPVIVLKKL